MSSPQARRQRSFIRQRIFRVLTTLAISFLLVAVQCVGIFRPKLDDGRPELSTVTARTTTAPTTVRRAKPTMDALQKNRRTVTIPICASCLFRRVRRRRDFDRPPRPRKERARRETTAEAELYEDRREFLPSFYTTDALLFAQAGLPKLPYVPPRGSACCLKVDIPLDVLPDENLNVVDSATATK